MGAREQGQHVEYLCLYGLTGTKIRIYFKWSIGILHIILNSWTSVIRVEPKTGLKNTSGTIYKCRSVFESSWSEATCNALYTRGVYTKGWALLSRLLTGTWSDDVSISLWCHASRKIWAKFSPPSSEMTYLRSHHTLGTR